MSEKLRPKDANPVRFFSIGSCLFWELSVDKKVVKFQFQKKISPTTGTFQAIKKKKNVNHVFLESDGAKQILFLTLFSHM